MTREQEDPATIGGSGDEVTSAPGPAVSPDTPAEADRPAVTRRQVLGWSLTAAAVGAGLSSPDVRQVFDGTQTATTAQVPVLWAGLVRPRDQLSLRWELHNFTLLTAGQGGPGDRQTARLVVADATRPGYVIVHFPPQHVAERAYVAGTPGFPGTAGDESNLLTTPVPAALTSGSRLAFEVPADAAPIPFTPDGLLSWQQFRHSVVPAAARVVTGRPGPQSPAGWQTSIEVPWGLELSPDSAAGWAHSTEPVTHNQRTELWHTRLGVRRPAPDGTGYVVDEQDERFRTVRAVWTPQYDRDRPPSPNDPGRNPPGRTSLTPRQRHEIVRLSSDYSMDVSTGSGTMRHSPAPIRANRLMLSALGAWMDTEGRWGSGVTPVGGQGKFTVQEWHHQATMGRDQHVTVVQDGFLFPFGHQASLVTVTERVFEPVRSPQGHPLLGKLAAFTRQRTFVVVREPERRYPELPITAAIGRAWPLKTIRVHTQVTPDLAPMAGEKAEPLTKVPRKDPTRVGGFFGADAFWPVVASAGGVQDFEFVVEGEDTAGNRSHFTAPLIFVSSLVSDDADATAQIQEGYGAKRERYERPMAGQRMALTALEGDSTYPVQRITLRGVPPEPSNAPLNARQQPRFFPIILAAKVRLDAVERISGAAAGSDGVEIGWHGSYLFGRTPNPGRVFAALTEPVDLTFGAERVGALLTPNMRIAGLSALTGPVGGTLTGTLPTEFDPEKFFAGALPKILGVLPLPKILTKAAFTAIDRLPRLLTRDLPDAVETSLTFRPVVKADDERIFVPNDPERALTVNVRSRVERGGGTPSSEIVAELTDFALNIAGTGDFGLMTITFNRLRFEARHGRKPTVDVDIADVRFRGVLEFLNPLQDFLAGTGLAPGLPPRATPGALATPQRQRAAGAPGPAAAASSNGPNISVTPQGVRAGYTLALPQISVGAFSLENVALSSVLNLPFVDGPARLRFAFSERERPFLLSVAIFGGGGFCALEMGLDGFERFEAALEFGARFALDLGVASGGVSAMAGVYLAMGDEGGEVTGYVRINGRLRVLGLVSLSLEFYLGLTYDTRTGEVYGQARLKVSVDIAFFSTSVTLGPIEKRFAGGRPQPAAPAANGGVRALRAVPTATAPPVAAGPPVVADVLSKPDWDDPVSGYCALFAPAAFA